MSTPRQKCKHENSVGHPADQDIRVCPDCDRKSEDGGSTWTKPAEGVAAPLEPHIHEIDDFKTQRCTVCGKYLGATPELEISARTFRRELDNGEFGAPTSVNAIEKCLEAYAAAVSKNLQEELANEIAKKQDWWQLTKEFQASSFKALERILELEKEIAALPKNGRWNAALDKAAEMLSRMEVIAGQPRATVEKAVVEIRKLKEITALREKP